MTPLLRAFNAFNAVLFTAYTAIQPVAAAEQPRERLSLDENWRFHLGDIPRDSFPGGQGVNLYAPDITYHGAKAGSVWGAAARGYDDKSWKQVNLPHDWVVEQPFEEKALKQQGYRQRGIGWYRRTFKLDPADRGRNLDLQFDGVATHCTVYFNGSEVRHNWSGYSSFHINVTPMARCGDDINTIAVRVDAEDTEGWWYEGGGIYRHTWLVKRSPVHIITDGVYANPVKSPNGAWVIPAEVTLANTGVATAWASVDIGLVDGGIGGGGADWGTSIVNGKFVLGVGSTGGDTTVATSANINDGTWHHLAATRNNTTGAMQVHVDGDLRGSGTGPTGSRNWPTVLRIGGRALPTRAIRPSATTVSNSARRRISNKLGRIS